MSGRPGSGKTLFARSLPSILPRLALQAALEISRMYSVNNMLPGESPLMCHRPFRAPHHTISFAGLIGCFWMNAPSLTRKGRFCELAEAGKQLMHAAMKPMNMSARAFHRILKLARTIADWAGCEKIETHYLAEAVRYRPRNQE